VSLCLQRGLTGPPAEEALGYMEQAKSRSLLDAIFGRAQPLPSRAAGDKRFEPLIVRLRGELNWYYNRIELEQFRPEGVSSDRVAMLWEQARAREDALLRVIRETRVFSNRRTDSGRRSYLENRRNCSLDHGAANPKSCADAAVSTIEIPPRTLLHQQGENPAQASCGPPPARALSGNSRSSVPPAQR